MDWLTEFPGQNPQELWIQGATNALAWGLLGWGLIVATVLLLGMLAIRNRRRRFWCEGAGRDVEVEFEERGLPGYHKAVTVLSCNAFGIPTEVRCDRACLDPGRRLQAPIERRAGGVAVSQATSLLATAQTWVKATDRRKRASATRKKTAPMAMIATKSRHTTSRPAPR